MSKNQFAAMIKALQQEGKFKFPSEEKLQACPLGHMHDQQVYSCTQARGYLGNYGGHITRFYLDLTCVLLTVPVS